jgi:hypothetical protein
VAHAEHPAPWRNSERYRVESMRHPGRVALRAPGPALHLTTDNGETFKIEGPAEHRTTDTAGSAHVQLPLAEAAAWLSGRAVRPDLPTLPAWL